MSLELIAGPARSGRTGLILDRFCAAIDRDPLLVVPTSDDVDRFERELCGRAGGLLGGGVTSFPGLFEEVARVYGIGAGDALSRLQRVWLARAAADRCELRLLAGSASHEGFAPALEGLIDDLQAAGLDAAAFRARVGELEGSATYETEIAELFGTFERLRSGLGRSDRHGLAAATTAALRADPGPWRERPVLLYGFDDLTREQIELIAALDPSCEVTVALSFEDRPALAARAELLGVLRDELGAGFAAELGPDPDNTASVTLFHLERNLFDPEPTTRPADGSLTLLEAAGERGEAELIGRRIAQLIAAGSDPDEIAIAVRSPDRQAANMARVLAGLGIPAAAEARVQLSSTATGSTLIRLLGIAAGEGAAEDVVAFLRGPARARPDLVDWLERRVRRGRLQTAAEALESWDREVWELSAVDEASDRGPGALAAAVARIAAAVAERPHARLGIQPSSGPAIELRAAAEVRRALTEVAELGRLAPGPDELAELLTHVRVPLWTGPTEGRVRILSPYRLRATQVEHLFVAGLTDGCFPATGAGGGDPLLSDERRRELGLPARRDPGAEERYLFYSCVSRPRHHLYLSYAGADESGAAVARSPFVDEVRALLDPPPRPDPTDDELEGELTERIGIGEIAPLPEQASSPRALARAVAALGEEAGARRLAALELPDEVRETVGLAVASARDGIAASARRGPLREPAVLEALAARELYGASTLEQYDVCSYRWFVSHELDPCPIEPDPEPLETGGIVHGALENLYREPPAGARPTEETLEEWTAAAHERLRESARRREWDLESPRARIALARLDAVLARFVRRDAATGGPMQPDPALLEAAFGTGPDDQYPAAEIGSFKLHGRVDRIDVSADGKALIRDYKLSSKVVAGAKLLKEGKLQLPLYMAAVRGMDLEPIGGLYHPLAASGDDRPRGLIAADEKDALVPGDRDSHVRTDFFDQASLDEVVDGAIERAEEIVHGIRAGDVTRNPREGKCPRWCTFAPICRMERSVVDPDDAADEDDAA